MLTGSRQLTLKLKIFSIFVRLKKRCFAFFEKRRLMVIISVCSNVFAALTHSRAHPLVFSVFFKTRDMKIDEKYEMLLVCVVQKLKRTQYTDEARSAERKTL